MPRPSIDPGFNRPMPSPEPVMNGDDGVFGDKPNYTRPFMPSPKDDSRAHYEPWIEQGISYEEYMRRMNGGMFKPAPDQRQPMPNTDPNMPWIPGTDQPNYKYTQPVIRRNDPWGSLPKQIGSIGGGTSLPISNQIGPGFGQPMPSNRLFDIIKGLMPGSSDPTRATQPVLRESNPWTPDGGYEYQPMPIRRTNPSWGLSPINKNLAPNYPAFPSTPGGSVQPSIPRQPRISQESFNTKPIGSWM